MIAARRTRFNFGLQRAAEWASELDKPLVVFEALRAGYRWASDRLHAFVIQGMADNAADLSDGPATYLSYLERKPGDGRGLLAELAKRAAVVISDDCPCFFLPRMLESARRQIPVRLELVDSNGLFPMRATDRVFSRAYDFRRFLQKQLLPHLEEIPKEYPLQGFRLPELRDLGFDLHERWPTADPAEVADDPTRLRDFQIDHDVEVVATRGGSRAATTCLEQFLDRKLKRYDDARNEPQEDVASGLSPYLHFGHISAHDVFQRIIARENWTPDQVADQAKGKSSGWWNMSAEAEAFLDELITWREVGYNRCALTDDFDQYESLPDWARKTLADHEDDPREHLYDLEDFEQARTHDRLWNAAQWELVTTGRMHNYLRMLWGKKILEWSPTPRDALDVMIELNNKYALDGRDPNSYSGIFWVLGRYDRAWGPERPIFGKIRYMTSDNTARKYKVSKYIERFHPPEDDE